MRALFSGSSFWAGVIAVLIGSAALIPAAASHVGATGGFWGPDAFCFSPGRTTALTLGHCAWCFLSVAGFSVGASLFALTLFSGSPKGRLA